MRPHAMRAGSGVACSGGGGSARAPSLREAGRRRARRRGASAVSTRASAALGRAGRIDRRAFDGLARFVDEHHGDAVANRIRELVGMADEPCAPRS